MTSAVAVQQDGSFGVPLEGEHSLELQVGGVSGYLPVSFFWPASPPNESTVVLEEGVEVQGVVVDAAGRPREAAVDVVVDLWEASFAYRTRAAADGSFQLTAPRHARLVAWTSDGVAWAPAQRQLQLRLAPLGDLSPLTLLAPEGEELARSRVALESADGLPVPYWVLTNLQRERGARPLVGPRGLLVLPGVPPGPYRLLVRSPSGALWSSPLVLPTTGQLHLVPEGR